MTAYRNNGAPLIEESRSSTVLPHDSQYGPCPNCGVKPYIERHDVAADGLVRGGVEVMSVKCHSMYTHGCGYTWFAHTYLNRRSWWARLWSWGY